MKNWLLSAYCPLFLSTEEILVELWWHVYQNEANVDQNGSYLAEVRMVNFAITFPCAATQLEYKQTRVTRFLLTSAEESIVVARKLTQPEKRIAMKIANFSSE